MIILPENPPKRKTHFDEFVVGETLTSYFQFSEREIIDFAEKYDQQDMHLDVEKAKPTRFGTLIGSGWMTAAVVIDSLVLTHIDIPGGIVGIKLEELRWVSPTLPNKKLINTVTVLESRRSKSIENTGVVVFRCAVDDEEGTRVLDMTIPTVVMIG